MMAWLGENFPAGKNYLVGQNHKEQINSFLIERMVVPFQSGRKHRLWGIEAERLHQIGRKLGWVPNKIPGTFLSDTVENEIADAAAAAENYMQPLHQHLDIARNLLSRLNLLHLAQSHPLFLSEGETKILWFLTQWVKKMSYLIIGYLPSSLSISKVSELVNFMLEENGRLDSQPVIILGYEPSQIEWCQGLFSHQDWQVVSALPE
jgi:ABC-type molybdenum transport system ATPase subunit/photorepair protein PhrA